MQTQKNATASIVSIISSSYFSIIISAVTSYFTLLLLGPAKLGLFQAVLLFKDYALFCNIGEIEAIRKNVPYLIAQSKQKALVEYLGDTIFVQLVTLFIVAGILFFLSFSFPESYHFTFYVIIFLYILEYLQYFFQNLAKSINKFNVLSRGTVYLSLVSLLSIFLIYILNYQGFLFGKIISDLFILIYFWHALKPQFKLNTSCKNFKYIYTSGIPMAVFSLLNIFLANSGKLGIFLFLDNYNMGLFSFALLTGIPFIQVAHAFSSVLFTKSSTELGSNYKRKDIINNIISMIYNINEYLPFANYMLVFLIPLFLPVFLPKYGAAVTASQLVLLGFSSYALALPFTNLLVLFNNKLYIISFLIPGIFIVIASYLSTKFNFGLTGIGYSVFLGYLLYFVLSIWSAVREGSYDKTEKVIIFKRLILKHISAAFLFSTMVLVINRLNSGRTIYIILVIIMSVLSIKKFKKGISYLRQLYAH